MDDPLPEPQVESDEAQSASFPCPHCGASIDPTTIFGTIIICPHCNTQFFAAADETSDEPSEEDSWEPAEEASREDELSELRIKQLSTLMRANYRTRSYFIVGTIGCLWVFIPLLMFAVDEIRASHHFTLWALAYLLFALGALLGAIKLATRWVEIQREINAARRARAEQELEAARHEPDLSTLSDGSQQAKKLEMMFTGKSHDSAGPEAEKDSREIESN